MKEKKMINQNKYRISTAIIMLISIIWGYWWISVILALIFLFLFPLYYEIIFWGVLYDALYGVPLELFYNIPYTFSILAIFIFTITFFIKKKLIVYETI